MGIIIDILDLIVLLAIIIQVPRTAFGLLPKGIIPLLLSILMVAALGCFSVVSFLIFSGMVASSSIEAVGLLIFLLVLLYFVRVSWTQPA